MLGDLDYKLCETALMELFATHTYPPQISEIREKCAEYTVPHLKDQGEAWGEVQKAISQYGYYRQESIKRGYGTECWNSLTAHYYRNPVDWENYRVPGQMNIEDFLDMGGGDNGDKKDMP